MSNLIGKSINCNLYTISDDYTKNDSSILASTKCVYNAVQEILSQTLTGDPWSLFPPKIPVAIDGVTFGGSDGRRAIMPGESEARENWIICDGGSDGKGGTVPDLRGRMILGASSTYAAGSTGGSATHTHSMSGTVGATTLTTNEMPKHSHSFTVVNDDVSGQSSAIIYGRRGGVSTRSVQETGGSSSHTHSLSNTSTTEEALLPPYYSLSYIIKIS